MRTPQLIGLMALASIWGASFMFIKVMLEEMGPLAVAWVRLGGGAALMLAVVAAKRTRLPRGARRWLDIAVVGLLGSALPYVLIPWGERRIDAGLAGVLNSAMPLFVAVLAHRVLIEERLDRMGSVRSQTTTGNPVPSGAGKQHSPSLAADAQQLDRGPAKPLCLRSDRDDESAAGSAAR